LLKGLKDYHVDSDKKAEADMVFSTVHRCKGMEYDEVTLEDDFVTPDKIRKILEESQSENPDITKLNEEVNLLYVAVTRSKNMLHIPAIYRTQKSRIRWVRAKKNPPPRFSDFGKKSEENVKRFSLQDYLKRAKQESDNPDEDGNLYF
jgi:superfamily I DNA/RNA helicase